MSVVVGTVTAMDLQLAGRRALVTGSSDGIGAAIARQLAAEDCAVMVHGRDRVKAQAVADEIGTDGSLTDVAVGDLSDPGEASRIASRAANWGVDILVNNAGPFAENDWDSATPESWLSTLDTNVMSAARLAHDLLPHLRERGWGRVINVGSRAATTPLPNMVEYSAAKAAVVNMTTSLAQHLAGTGITANTVSPGVIVTEGMRRMFERRAAERGEAASWPEIERDVVEMYAPNPTQRLGTPDDIADTIAFLSSPRAGYINGINVRVDGGLAGVP